MNKLTVLPVSPSQRFVILDALRGFAILGIALANFQEFSLYSFLSPDDAAALPASGPDRVVRYLLYAFVDGKFYTLFSLLFGIGFSIILENVTRRGGDALRIFYRRMALLALIGFLHLMFIWSGDILMLYALMGMVLPLFRKASDRTLLTVAFVLLFLPVCMDALCEISGFDPSAGVVAMQQTLCSEFGITDENFAYWLRDASSYGGVFDFLKQGALVRVQEFIDGNRYFKVLGLFLVGYYMGRHRWYAGLPQRNVLLKKIFRIGMCFGLPLSLVYAWSAVNGHPFGTALHSLLYFVSVYALSFSYAAGFCLLYVTRPRMPLLAWLAAPGRMALSNYIGQSLAGMLLFYGIGLGLGAGLSLWIVELTAAAIFVLQQIFSRMWLTAFRFGPLEWIWRMMTYGHWIDCRNGKS